MRPVLVSPNGGGILSTNRCTPDLVLPLVFLFFFLGREDDRLIQGGGSAGTERYAHAFARILFFFSAFLLQDERTYERLPSFPFERVLGARKSLDACLLDGCEGDQDIFLRNAFHVDFTGKD